MMTSGRAPLTPDEIERYARHIILPEIGGAGQQRLAGARVVVIGAGGLGSPALQYLAAAGVGRLAIVDDDIVTLSNLQRQVLHSTDRVGSAKTASAATAIAAINPHVSVETISARLVADNVDAIVGGADCVVDGSDNFETRYRVADRCAALRVPLVSGALGRFDGSLTTLTPFRSHPDGTPHPGYRDIFPAPPPPGTVPSCAEAGILGAVAGVIGTLQAVETVKLLTGIGETLTGRLLLFDALAMRFEIMAYRAKGAPA